jgi:hypothetical protein
MRNAWIIVPLTGAALTLNGCVLPPIVTLASYSVDIVTYEATGKTATDHAYSAIARSDCSFTRVLYQKPICVDPPPEGTESAVAAATPPTIDAEQKAPPASVASSAAAPDHTTKVAIGSFRDRANAERSVARYADWHPVIADVTIGGQIFHRVVASSLSSDEATALKTKLAANQPRLRLALNQ